MAKAQRDQAAPATPDRAASVPGNRTAVTGRNWQARLVLLGAIWGMSFLFIKVGDEALAPLQVALGRMFLGTAVLLGVLAVRRERLPRFGKVWIHLAGSALLLNVAPFTLFAYGETHVTSVVAGIWNATTPLVTLPVAMLILPYERASRDRVIGLVLGFAGVLILLRIWQGVGAGALSGNLACLAAASCYGIGFPYIRKHLAGSGESALALSAGQLLCGVIELAIITPLFTTAPARLPLDVIGALLALGVFGTGIAYVINYSLIRDVGATTASTVTYLLPLFSTAAGVLILGEALTWNQPVGAAVVILGIAVSQGRVHIAARRRPEL